MYRLLLSLPLFVVVTLAGCSSSKNGGKGAEPPSDRYRIAVIPKGLTHEFWQSIERGSRRRARAG